MIQCEDHRVRLTDCILWPHLMTWFSGDYISNYIHCFVWDVIGHPCPTVNGGSTTPTLKLRHRWINTSYFFHVDGITYLCPDPNVGLANFGSLTAPSHHLNQCWLIIKSLLWHSPHSYLNRNTHEPNQWYASEIVLLRLVPHLQGASELKWRLPWSWWNYTRSFFYKPV